MPEKRRSSSSGEAGSGGYGSGEADSGGHGSGEDGSGAGDGAHHQHHRLVEAELEVLPNADERGEGGEEREAARPPKEGAAVFDAEEWNSL